MQTINEMNVSDFRGILLSNFYKFVKFINIKKENKILVPRNDLYKELCNSISQSEKNTLILLPRRHLKTLIASLFVIWYIFKYPNQAVVIITDTRQKGITLLKGIKSIIMHHKGLNQVFNCEFAKKGNNEDIITLGIRTTFAKEPNVKIFSIEQPIQSARADMILFEDIVGDQFVKSNANRETVRYNFKSAFSILEEKSKVVVTGTRYTIDDIYADIIEENTKLSNWTIISKSVYTEDKKALCEYVMSLEEIHQIEMKNTVFYFASQYLNDPVNSTVNIFNLNDYETFQNINLIDIQKIYFGVDLSDGIGQDKSAVSVVGMDKDKCYYLIDIFSSANCNSIKLYEELRRLYELYKTKTTKVIVELNRNGRTILNDTFMRLERNYADKIPFQGIMNTESKFIRIEKLEPLLRNSQLILPDLEENKFRDFTSEIIRYNRNDRNNSDDCLDAISIAITMFSRDLQYSQQSRSSTQSFKIFKK